LGDPILPPGLRRRRIIERPRLIKALDDSPARIKLLVAGPGYGKTTLLEQWASQTDREISWLRIRPAHNDVAELARSVGEALGSGTSLAEKVRERLVVSVDPASEVDALTGVLLRDVHSSGLNRTVLVDDHHVLDAGGASDRFIGALIRESQLEFVVSSRARPSWIPRREVLYGEVLEVSQSVLAMTADESAVVLMESNPSLAQGLSALADGWPAVIGMAALSPDASTVAPVDLPETLYEYFAEEVYRGLDTQITEGLQTLAQLPVLDAEVATSMLRDSSSKVCEVGLSLGILEARDGRFDFHPLAIAFLEERSRRMGRKPEPPRAALSLYEERRDWDACLVLVRRHRLADDYIRLLGHCLGDLLTTSRLATLETWVSVAEEWGVTHPSVAVAQAEVELRHGRHLSALTIAHRESDSLDPAMVDPRLFAIGARAAHAGSLEEDALKYYELAQRFAVSDADRREASWGMLMCLAALERPSAQNLLAELEATTSPADARDQVRLADKRLSVGFRFGFVRHLGEARRVAELVPGIKDPAARCSFRSMFAWALVLSAAYDEALREANRLVDDAAEYRVDYARPYGHTAAAAALAGLRSFDAALERVSIAAADAARTRDEYGIQNAYSIRVRILVQCGRAAEACATEPPDLSRSLPTMRGEALASRALALATLGRVDEATTYAQEAMMATSGIEANGVGAVALAVSGLKARRSSAREECERLILGGFASGAVDPIVAGYRGNLDLLAAFLANADCRDQAVYLLGRAGDEELAKSLATDSTELVDPVSTLSAREREIYALLCEGMKNAEIAKLLFISEATVKVHVKHVFNKLGIRSRTALALNAARRESRRPDDGPVQHNL